MSQKKKKRRKVSRKLSMWSRIATVLLVIGLVVLGLIISFQRATYSHIEVVDEFREDGLGDGQYILYEDGFLEYARDGVAMLSKDGEELWNQPCQLANPIAEVCEKAAAVGDKGGTEIYVFHKKGLKGEIRTDRPIEKIAVSSQGIVAAVLQDEENPMIMCYDAKGKILVQQKTSLKNTGYPIGLSISQDGMGLLVSYLQTSGNVVSTKIVYYYFGENEEISDNHVVAEAEYENEIAPTVAFMDEKHSAVITDSSLVFYRGVEKPVEHKRVKLDAEIKSVAYNEKYVAVVLNRVDEEGYDLRLYRANGKLAMATQFEGEYSNLRVVGKYVLLYEDTRCQIFNHIGVCKYSGNLEFYIQNIFPEWGFNKYKVINAEGFHEIQLAR